MIELGWREKGCTKTEEGQESPSLQFEQNDANRIAATGHPRRRCGSTLTLFSTLSFSSLELLVNSVAAQQIGQILREG